MPLANLDIVRLVLLQAFEPLETYHLYGPPGPRELTTHQETYSFLSTCCLVSKGWYGVAAPLLYSTIVLSFYEQKNEDGDEVTIDVVESLMEAFQVHPDLLLHVRTISGQWDALLTSFILDRPHSYPNLVKLGALTIEWWTARSLAEVGSWMIPKVVGLAKRFPSLVELRINLAHIQNAVEKDSATDDLRSPSLRLPETLKKLSVSGPDGLVSLDALTNNSLPHLVEFEIETFGDGTSTLFAGEDGLSFFQKFGNNLTSLSLSHRFVRPDHAAIFHLIRHSPHDPAPPYIFNSCSSLQIVAIQGLGLDHLLLQGHQTLETIEFGLIDQPRHIASALEITLHVDLYNRLNSFLHYFKKDNFPLLQTMKVASLDFRHASTRNWITLQQSVPLLVDQGIHFFDWK